MFYVLQNESTAARRRVPILLTDAATGTTAQTGIALTNIFPYVNINGGAFAGGAGTVGEAGFGQYYYQMDPSEVSTLGLAGIHITAAGCRDYDAITQIAAFNVYSPSAGGGISAFDVWNYVLSDANTAEADLVSAASGGAGISAYDVWEYDISGVSFSNQAGYELLNASTNSNTIVSTTNDINNQTQPAYIASSVWSDDLSTGPNAPYAAGTAGTILYGLSLGGGGITAGDVWSYATRTITGGIADTVQLVSTPVNVSTSSMSGIANSVWDFVITGFGQTGSAALYSTQTLFTTGNIETYVANQTPQDVWTYSGIEGRTITGGIADTVTTVTNPVLVNTSSMTGIAGTVWNYATRTLTSGGSGLTAGDVWSYATRTITGGTIDTNNDKTGYSLSGTQSFNLTGNITGNLSGSVGSVSGSVASVTNPVSVDTASMTGIAGTVWNYVTRTLTSGGGSGLTAGDVWSYATRTLTGAVSVDTASMTGIAGTVWNSLTASYSTNGTFGKNILRADAANKTGDVTLYSSGGVNGVDADVHRIANDTAAATSLKNILTGIAGETLTANITGNVSGSVNSVTQPVDVSTASMTGIAGTVWNAVSRTITGGTITTVSDKTGYSLSSSQTFNLTGNITGNLSGSVGSVTNPVTLATASMTGIAGTVWSYGTRTLTSGSGISAADVWNYNISGITTSGSAGKQLNDASVSGSVVTIVNGPYKLNSTAEGTDGRIDILQGSVQTINLSLVNGFGQPFNVSGYTLSVDIYDVASTLVESYVPVVNYANGGNISFDIDTTVTGVIGTYNLIVSLTNGDVVQVGPITILVRPL